jgi:hypothetical protein
MSLKRRAQLLKHFLRGYAQTCAAGGRPCQISLRNLEIVDMFQSLSCENGNLVIQSFDRHPDAIPIALRYSHLGEAFPFDYKLY